MPRASISEQRMSLVGVYSATDRYILRSQPQVVNATSAVAVAVTPDDAQSQSDKVTLSQAALKLSLDETSTPQEDARSTAELAGDAKRLLDQIQGPAYDLSQVLHNQEMPKSTDPAALERAKQATAYLNGLSQDFKSTSSNPFEDMSRDQLARIVYDDSGAFTVNERRAAKYASDQQEYEWRQAACAKAVEEWGSTGKMTNFFESCLKHFESLPEIEQVQYPDYVNDLLQKISGH